jgi:hypothetical protein
VGQTLPLNHGFWSPLEISSETDEKVNQMTVRKVIRWVSVGSFSFFSQQVALRHSKPVVYPTTLSEQNIREQGIQNDIFETPNPSSQKKRPPR